MTDGAPAELRPPAPVRHEILRATYACIARAGLARVTVEDAAREAGVSRATVYRHFPGGRDELVRDTVGHEVAHFFLDLADAVAGAPTVAAVLEEALLHAHAAVTEHEVLQKLLATEPDRLLPNLTLEANRLLPPIAEFLEPHLRRLHLRAGVEVSAAAEYVARMVLSLVGSPGRWDLTDRHEVAELVRCELLAGIVGGGGPVPAPPAGPVAGRPPAHRTRPAAVGDPAPPDVGGPDDAEGRVVAAALVCLSRWGIAKTSLEDIAREAGVSRATAYRLFPGGKDTVLDATLAAELVRFTTELRARLDGAADLEALLVRGVTFSSQALAGHAALQYLLAHEPEQLLPHVSFGRFDQLLAATSSIVAPQLAAFVGDRALRTGEWATRLVLSYAAAPSPTYDLTDEGSARCFVRTHLLPGLPGDGCP
ncbi:MAG: hypothetical protein AVDCRST_MAG20-804 [uncultured Acidimicrobiales bacterium]|uniref:HTH tetR-type domain-containing protein n=1 Tax=uncultured Acidimicrobiales bacterium TaxID=310071 RepID=A0A6J4HJZ6_9ACTN|nr:MAG: hypothetical protein AVDCRST_MAG20-804 [uncultured Acidimicrobiales bacterium]